MNAQTQASKNALHKSLERRHNASTSLAALWRPALLQAFVKLDPRQLLRSPVMLVVELTAVLTTLLCFVSDQAVPTDVRLFRIYEGTTQIQQLLIARNMIRAAQG